MWVHQVLQYPSFSKFWMLLSQWRKFIDCFLSLGWKLVNYNGSDSFRFRLHKKHPWFQISNEVPGLESSSLISLWCGSILWFPPARPPWALLESPGVPLYTMDHNHPESSQLKLGRSSSMDQYSILGESSPHYSQKQTSNFNTAEQLLLQWAIWKFPVHNWMISFGFCLWNWMHWFVN